MSNPLKINNIDYIRNLYKIKSNDNRTVIQAITIDSIILFPNKVLTNTQKLILQTITGRSNIIY